MIHQYKALLLLLATVAFASTLRCGFMFDDRALIESNERVHAWSISNVRTDFEADIYHTAQSNQYYRPLLTFSDRLDHTLWGLHPTGYHFTNLLLHLGCVWLLFDLLLLLSGSSLAAFVAASIFAVHPLYSDLFLLITTRSEQMGMLFSLVVILELVAASPVRWVVALPFYVLALFAKESNVMTPALVALIFWYQRQSPKAYIRLLPLAATTIPYLWLRHHIVGPVLSTSLLEMGHFLIGVFPSAAVKYASLVVWPHGLHFLRHLPEPGVNGILFWGALAGLVIQAVRGYRTGLFCAGWFLLCLAPKTLTMIHEGSMMEHWMYASLMMLVLPLGQWIARGWESRNQKAHTMAGVVWAAIVITEIIACQWTIWNRNTEEKAFRTVLHYEQTPVIRVKLAALLWQSGRPAEALPYIEPLYNAMPADPRLGQILASIYWDLGQSQRSIAILETLAASHPGDPVLQRNLKVARSQASPHLQK